MYPILMFIGPLAVRTATIVALAAVVIGTQLAARRLGRRGLPPQAYETLAGLSLTALLLLAERRGTRAGDLFLLLVIGLALERGLFDPVRGDAIWISNWMTSGQVVGILVAGAFVFIPRRDRHVSEEAKGKEP